MSGLGVVVHVVVAIHRAWGMSGVGAPRIWEGQGLTAASSLEGEAVIGRGTHDVPVCCPRHSQGRAYPGYIYPIRLPHLLYSMRPPACTVAQRTPLSPAIPMPKVLESPRNYSLFNRAHNSQDIYRLRRSQLIHYPRATRPLGPITLLPLEILTHVFLSCVQDDEDYASNVPLVLAQVCSSWRKSVLKLPQLWTRLRINLTARTLLPSTSPFIKSSSPSHLSRSSEALTNLASLWFERAKNQLLSVTIRLTTKNASAVQDVSSSLIQPILSNAKSIRHLSIHASSYSQLAKLFSRADAEFTNLESLSLSIQHFESSPLSSSSAASPASASTSSSPITTFTHSPRLSKVYFDLNGSPPSTSMIHLPWAQLEQFSMTGASMLPADECRRLLSTCTNLRKASVWVDDSVTDSQSDHKSPTTLLPNLTHLSVSYYGRHEKTVNSLLTSFDLPHLRQLHLFSGFITLPSIPPITSRHLETLSISGVDVSAAQLANLALATSSSLRSLAVDLRYCSGEIPAIASVLAPDSPSTALVFPYLSTLSLWTRHISPNSASYAQLVRSRSHNPNNTPLCLDVYLARQRHGICRCSFCVQKTTSPPSSSVGSSHVSEIMSLFDVCERSGGVVLRIKDVRPDEGIAEAAAF